jgi:two-component system invasion response regulator UvrY
MIYVLIVDDHDIVRIGIKRLLDDVRGIKVIAEAESGEQALEKIRRRRPDIILMDVNMPGIGGLEATRKLLKVDPTLKIIALTVHGEEPYPTRMLEAGAEGYVTKGCGLEEMVTAIKTVHKGERYVGDEIAQQVALGKLPGGVRSPFDKLSQREIQVMLMVTQGYTIQEISDQLCLSPKTISTYRYRLYEKLAVENDVELTHLAMRHGMVELSA